MEEISTLSSVPSGSCALPGIIDNCFLKKGLSTNKYRNTASLESQSTLSDATLTFPKGGRPCALARQHTATGKLATLRQLNLLTFALPSGIMRPFIAQAQQSGPGLLWVPPLVSPG